MLLNATFACFVEQLFTCLIVVKVIFFFFLGKSMHEISVIAVFRLSNLF